MNWYAYCRGNPLRYVDPTGLISDGWESMYATDDLEGWNPYDEDNDWDSEDMIDWWNDTIDNAYESDEDYYESILGIPYNLDGQNDLYENISKALKEKLKVIENKEREIAALKEEIDKLKGLIEQDDGLISRVIELEEKLVELDQDLKGLKKDFANTAFEGIKKIGKKDKNLLKAKDADHFIIFDGKNLNVYDREGNLVGSYKAGSGSPKLSFAPIPEGIYYVAMSKIKSRKFGQKGWTPGTKRMKDIWGDHWVPIEGPGLSKNDAGYYIHGDNRGEGYEYLSAGCIDIGARASDFYDFFSKTDDNVGIIVMY